jgi:hypothetical protein
VGSRPLLVVVILVIACMQTVARAQPSPVPIEPHEPSPGPGPAEPMLSEVRSATWPLALGINALIGVEPHDRGNPVAFGVGTELLWRARLGGFAMLLASEGLPVVAKVIGNQQQAFGDRISVPFGFALRPLAWLGLKRRDYWGRVLTAIGAQVGITVEHVRTSDDNATTAGLHLGLGVDVPLWGGTREGGIALRVYARMMATPSIMLDPTIVNPVYEPPVSGQFFAGITYYP